MADLKISQLPVFTSAVPATDAFAVVSGGTTKQITTNQILGSSGVATLASATITGALTVQGNGPHKFGASNYSQFDQSSLQFVGSRATPGALSIFSNTNRLFFQGDTGGYLFQNGANTLTLLSIANDATQVTLNSTGLGIGAVPASGIKLNVHQGGSTSAYLKISNGDTGSTTGDGLDIILNNAAGNYKTNFLLRETGAMGFWTDSTERLVIDATGNVGIGVTPSAWGGFGNLQLVNGSVSVSGYDQSLGVNYFSHSSGAYKYTANGKSVKQGMFDGKFIWSVSGTVDGVAGDVISYTQAMTLDASGNLLVGTTSASGRVAVDTDLATYNGMAVKNTGTTYGASSFFFRFINSSGVTAGSIQHTAVTTTNYSTTSDSRLKESKGISTDTSVIDNTIVRDFVWKADGSTDRGVFAQEAQSVKPRAISAGSDDLTEDGNIKTPWSVDYSKYVPDLIVYCQQLKKQVVELTARVQTLEAR